MITYLYWAFVIFLAGGALYLIGFHLKKWVPGLVISLVILLVFGLLYYFYLQQMFVKRWGGTMSITVPQGEHHMLATWKGDNLWIESYDPENNQCIFQEYSRGNVMQGKVILKNCDPLSSSNGGFPQPKGQ